VNHYDITPVSRDFAIRAAAYLGVLAALFAALGPDLRFLGGFTAACAWSLLFERRHRHLLLPSVAKIALIASGAAVFLTFLLRQLRADHGDPTIHIARFLAWNAAIFAISRAKTEHDLWTLAIIDLSLFMIAGAFAPSARFAPLFLISLTATILAFVRLSLLRCGRTSPRWAWVALLQLAVTLEIGAAVFLLFPRRLFPYAPSAGGVHRGSDAPKPPTGPAPDGDPIASRDTARTGVPSQSDYVTLTHLSALKKDPRVVLSLELEDSPTEKTAYLRGAVLDQYEKGAWSARFDKRPIAGAGWSDIPLRKPATGRAVTQRIRLEPVTDGLLFALPEPTRIRLADVRYDSSGILFLAKPAREAVNYEVASRIPQEVDVSRIVSTPSEPRYRRLPPGLDSLRSISVRETRAAKTQKEKLEALLAWMRRGGFAYRMAAFVSPPGTDPAEHFLLRSREGTCVHFATAFALLARGAGIPCRLATGFLLKEYDPTARRFLARNSDAHAWVEVDFGDAGWIPYDPTPPDAIAPPTGEPVASGKKDVPNPTPMETPARRSWDRLLLEYGIGEQGGLASAGWRGLREAGKTVARPVVGIGAALLLGLLFGGYLLLPAARRRRIRQSLVGFQAVSTVDFYQDFLWILGRRGFRKSSGQTGWEFARQARAACDDSAIDRVTELFYRVRFAGGSVTEKEQEEIERILERLSRPSGSA